MPCSGAVVIASDVAAPPDSASGTGVAPALAATVRLEAPTTGISSSTVRVAATLPVAPFASVAVTVKAKLPSAVGVPDSVPSGPSVRPAGKRTRRHRKAVRRGAKVCGESGREGRTHPSRRKVDGATVSTGGVTVMLTVAGAETPPALLAV